MIDDQFKYVRYLGTSKEELYRYKTDENEQHNLVGSEPETSKRMRGLLLKTLDGVNDREIPRN